MEKPLDTAAMKQAARHLVGEHDFREFEKTGSPRCSTVRTLSQLDVKSNGHYIFIRLVGDGFLYGMARNLAGTLLRVGQQGLDPESIPAGLAGGSHSVAGPCLAARGLCLVRVEYGETS